MYYKYALIGYGRTSPNLFAVAKASNVKIETICDLWTANMIDKKLNNVEKGYYFRWVQYTVFFDGIEQKDYIQKKEGAMLLHVIMETEI